MSPNDETRTKMNRSVVRDRAAASSSETKLYAARLTFARASAARIDASFTERPLVCRTKVMSSSDAFADDADQRRVGSIAGVEIAALQQRLADALEIAGHRDARVRCVHTARLGCRRSFGGEQHQCPRRVDWRRRHNRGGFYAWHCLQVRQRSFQRVLFRCGGGKES